MKRIALRMAALASTAVLGAGLISGVGADDEALAPIHGIALPHGYRDGRLISVAHEAGDRNDLRAILGNDSAIEAYRKGTLPFPDGTIIARLAWQYLSSAENNEVFARAQSFVAGAPSLLRARRCRGTAAPACDAAGESDVRHEASGVPLGGHRLWRERGCQRFACSALGAMAVGGVGLPARRTLRGRLRA